MQKSLKEKKKRKLKIAKLKERKKIKKVKKHNSYKYLHQKAWKLFSKYVRMKGANWKEENVCYTCGKRLPVKELEAGHFHHNKLDFDERNIKPQCGRCNNWLSGNLAIFGTKLAAELGADGMKQLLLDANTKFYTCEELKEIIAKYENTKSN